MHNILKQIICNFVAVIDNGHERDIIILIFVKVIALSGVNFPNILSSTEKVSNARIMQ